MVLIPAAGLAKVQKLPHSHWQELKTVRTKPELLTFIRKHPKIEGVLVQELGEGVARRIVSSGQFRGESDLIYVTELLKSAILRGAGSEKSMWAPWTVGGETVDCAPFNGTNAFSFSESGQQFAFDVPGLVSIPKASFSRLKKATEILFRNLDPLGRKFLIRADFVLESSPRGGRWWLVDVGESNLALVLASRLHSAAHTGNEFASRYVDLVKSILPERRKLLVAYQDDELRESMSFEFLGLSRIMAERGIHADFITKAQLLSLLAQSDLPKFALEYAVLRLFRHLELGDMGPLSAACSQGLPILDSPCFAGFMRKSSVERAVWKARAELSKYVGVPRGMLVALDRPADASDAILSCMSGAGISEIVVKPGSMGTHYLPTAFFYDLCNTRHLDELRRTLHVLQKAGVSSVIAEELVGNGAVNGRKIEVRLWCFRDELKLESRADKTSAV